MDYGYYTLINRVEETNSLVEETNSLIVAQNDILINSFKSIGFFLVLLVVIILCDMVHHIFDATYKRR